MGREFWAEWAKRMTYDQLVDMLWKLNRAYVKEIYTSQRQIESLLEMQ